MSDLRRAVVVYIQGLILGGVIAGVVLAFAVPWLWHVATAHVSFH